MHAGLLMTAYLKYLGMAETELSIYRGLGALSGVLATFAFPWLQRTTGKLENDNRDERRN